MYLSLDYVIHDNLYNSNINKYFSKRNTQTQKMSRDEINDVRGIPTHRVVHEFFDWLRKQRNYFVDKTNEITATNLLEAFEEWRFLCDFANNRDKSALQKLWQLSTDSGATLNGTRLDFTNFCVSDHSRICIYGILTSKIEEFILYLWKNHRNRFDSKYQIEAETLYDSFAFWYKTQKPDGFIRQEEYFDSLLVKRGILIVYTDKGNMVKCFDFIHYFTSKKYLDLQKRKFDEAESSEEIKFSIKMSKDVCCRICKKYKTTDFDALLKHFKAHDSPVAKEFISFLNDMTYFE
jgi:hypothetical protein